MGPIFRRLRITATKARIWELRLHRRALAREFASASNVTKKANFAEKYVETSKGIYTFQQLLRRLEGEQQASPAP